VAVEKVDSGKKGCEICECKSGEGGMLKERYGLLCCTNCVNTFRTAYPNRTNLNCKSNSNCSISESCLFCFVQRCLRLGMNPCGVQELQESKGGYKKQTGYGPCLLEDAAVRAVLAGEKVMSLVCQPCKITCHYVRISKSGGPGQFSNGYAKFHSHMNSKVHHLCSADAKLAVFLKDNSSYVPKRHNYECDLCEYKTEATDLTKVTMYQHLFSKHYPKDLGTNSKRKRRRSSTSAPQELPNKATRRASINSIKNPPSRDPKRQRRSSKGHPH